MKKIYLIVLGFITTVSSIAQDNQAENTSFRRVIIPDTFYTTQPLREMPNAQDLFPEETKEHSYYNNFRRQKYVNQNAFPHGNDPVWQKTHGEQYNKSPIQNWEGQNPAGSSPPDPSGAAGPNHYVQMINSTIQVFDKTGTSLTGPNAMNTILSSNGGDPIVMYDRFADRWLISGFGNGWALSIAVSTSPDPTGTYNVWEYTMTSLPDYPKYALWHDGYYITTNKSGEDCFVVDRDAMIAGSASPQIISMTIPNLGTGDGTSTGGFHSVVPSHADFVMPATSEKLNLFYFQDDAWSGITQDEIKIWEVNVDWVTTSNSNVTEIQTLSVNPFDSQFNSSWNDIEQPGSSLKLDGVPGAFMYRAQFTEWITHNTVMLNHTVDVDATNHAGIRWYELRETGGVWSVFQQSTYAPDSQSRWLGSISMDYQGNIGLAYSVSGSTIFPSLRYTGRYSTDALNTMTITEESIFNGSGIKSGSNRYGDYSHMSIDPDDDATFWFTGEYVEGGDSKTRIVSFKFASDYNNDLGIIALTAPVDGSLAATENVTVTIKNFGLDPQNNFPVSYQINGGTVISETYNAGPIAPNTTVSYTFTNQGDFSIPGQYDVKSYTGLVTDQFNPNDTLNTTVNHLYANDIGVTIINSPNTGNVLGAETVQVTIENFGTVAQSSFDVTYTIDGGTPVIETVASTVNVGSTILYSFTTTADLSLLGTYDIIAYSNLASDSQNSNDTTYKTVENKICQPTALCSSGDGFSLFKLGTINNSTGCSSDGYEDYTSMSTDLFVGYSHDVTVSSGWNIQYISVWIDYNDNFLFEASEKVIDGFQSNLGATTNFNLDANATLGEHLLRAKSSDVQNNVSDPCNDFQYGETEDYKVVLLSDVGIEEETTQNAIQIIAIDGNVYTLKLNDDININGIIEIHNTLGQLVYTAQFNNTESTSFTVDLSNYAVGPYLINVLSADSNSLIKLIKK